MRLGYSENAVHLLFDALGETGRRAYLNLLWTVDLILPALFGLFLSTAIRRGAFRRLSWIPLLASVCDYAENIAITPTLIALSAPRAGNRAIRLCIHRDEARILRDGSDTGARRSGWNAVWPESTRHSDAPSQARRTRALPNRLTSPAPSKCSSRHTRIRRRNCCSEATSFFRHPAQQDMSGPQEARKEKKE